MYAANSLMGRPGVSKPLARVLMGLLAALLPAAGCAKIKAQLPQPPVADVRPAYNERQKEGVKDFEQKRDFAQYQAAISRFNQNDHSGCRDLLERLLQRNANHLPSLLLLAELHLLNQQPQNALHHLEHAVTVYPDHAAVHHALGQAKEALGSRQEAVTHFERALELAPKSPLYLESLQSAHEGERQPVQPVSHQTPVRVAAAAASTSPAKPLAPAIQEWLDGGVAALADDNSAAAAECFQRAMELDPQNPHIATTATIKALESLQPELAVALAQSGLAQMPLSAPLYGLLGTAQYRMGNLELAEAAFIQAVNLDNTHAVSYFLLGCTQSKLGRHEDARLNLQQARKLNPRYVLGK